MCSSLTALSQTGESSPDADALTGLPTDPDLHNRTPADSPDTWHETTDQKGSAAATRGSRPEPPCMAPVAPLFHPLPSYADAAGSSRHQRGGTRTPDGGFDVTGRRAISGPLTPANRGLSRSLTDGLVRRSSSVETRMAQLPKLTVRVRFPSLAPGS